MLQSLKIQRLTWQSRFDLGNDQQMELILRHVISQVLMMCLYIDCTWSVTNIHYEVHLLKMLFIPSYHHCQGAIKANLQLQQKRLPAYCSGLRTELGATPNSPWTCLISNLKKDAR